MLSYFGVSAEQLTKITVALVVGGLIGLERELSHKPAGLRTHILVCLSSTLLTIVSMDYFPADSARIAAGVITGMGFLGAGSVIASKGNVHGLTTAASLWMIAAIGIGIGAGAYAISILTAILVLIILIFIFKPKN